MCWRHAKWTLADIDLGRALAEECYEKTCWLRPGSTAVGLGSAANAEYPEKPLTLVVSFPAGGNADIVARIQAEALSDELGVPVNVVKHPRWCAYSSDDECR